MHPRKVQAGEHFWEVASRSQKYSHQEAGLYQPFACPQKPASEMTAVWDRHHPCSNQRGLGLSCHCVRLWDCFSIGIHVSVHMCSHEYVHVCIYICVYCISMHCTYCLHVYCACPWIHQCICVCLCICMLSLVIKIRLYLLEYHFGYAGELREHLKFW